MINRNDWIPRRLFTGMVLTVVPALFGTGGCSPSTGGAVDQNALDQAARAVVRQEERVAPQALADMVISDRSPLEIIDLRPRADFEAGHIEGARHAELTAVLSLDGRTELAGVPMPVLVSADGSQAAQAAALLRVAGVNAYVLDGGYAAWRRLMEAEDAGVPVDAAAARAEAKRRAVACRFEGDYVAAAGLAVKRDAAPPPAGGYVPPLAPVTPAEPSAPAADPLGLGLGLGLPSGTESTNGPPRKLKIREGC